MDNMVEFHQLEEDHAVGPCIAVVAIRDGLRVLHRVDHDPYVAAAMDAYHHHQLLHFLLDDDIMVASHLQHHRCRHCSAAPAVRNFTDHLPTFAHLKFIDGAVAAEERHTAAVNHHLVISTIAAADANLEDTLDLHIVALVATIAIDTVVLNSLRFTFGYCCLGFVVGHHGNAATANFDLFYTFDYYQTIIIFAV